VLRARGERSEGGSLSSSFARNAAATDGRPKTAESSFSPDAMRVEGSSSCSTRHPMSSSIVWRLASSRSDCSDCDVSPFSVASARRRPSTSMPLP
jgi:hypothetical protein